MQSPKSPNSKGPGLAGTVALIAGMLAFFWLAAPGHQSTWPHHAISWLGSLAGQPLPAFARSALGAVLVAVLAYIPAMILEGGNKDKARKRDATKAAKVAMETDAERSRLESEARGFRDSGGMVKDFSGEKAKAQQATPAFVFSLVGAGIVILILAQIVLSHLH